jgi:hypothetical protein
MAPHASSVMTVSPETGLEQLAVSPGLALAESPTAAQRDRLRPLEAAQCSLCGIARPLGLHRQLAGVLRLSVPGGLAPRPLRGLRHADPLEQRAPGPGSKHAAASAITAASAPARVGRVGPQAVPPAAHGRQ